MDGVFHENDLVEEVFYEIIPTHEEVVQVTGILKKRLLNLMGREENKDNEDTALSQIQAQSVQNRDEVFKSPRKIGKVWDPPFEEFRGTRCCYNDGFSLELKRPSPNRISFRVITLISPHFKSSPRRNLIIFF